jgi:hypothetical protein
MLPDRANIRHPIRNASRKTAGANMIVCHRLAVPPLIHAPQRTPSNGRVIEPVWPLDLSGVSIRFAASCNCYQLSPVRPASTLPSRPCRLTPASFSTTASAAASGSRLNRAIAVCSAHTARCRARRSSRTGSAVEVASVWAIVELKCALRRTTEF